MNIDHRATTLSGVRTLDELESVVDNCPRCQKQHNPLRHVFGGGHRLSPDFCFVLINPTHSNISTKEGYEGPRFPFIGVKRFWKVLHRGGFIADEVIDKVERKPWDAATTDLVLRELERHRIYLTNLVKCTGDNPDIPSTSVFEEDFPVFSREMALVQPRHIVAFGQVTFWVLTGQKIKLGEHYDHLPNTEMPHAQPSRPMEGRVFPVIPNFFPVGRGNPTRSVEVLRKIQNARLSCGAEAVS